MNNDKKFIILVEGASDIKFMESYIQYLSKSIKIELTDFKFESIGGSDDKAISLALKSIEADINSNPILKIGVMLDIDDLTKEQRQAQVNNALEKIFSAEKINQTDNNFVLRFQYSPVKNISIFTHFVDEFENVNNLEQLLQTLITTDPIAANCLADWKKCCTLNNRKISNSEYLKFWREVYVRFDYCADKNLKKHAVDNCTIEKSYSNMLIADKPKAWNFDSQYLEPLKLFINNFIDN